MRFMVLCSAVAGALVALPALAQTQPGPTIRSDPGLRAPAFPSTGTSGDAAGLSGTTAPRSPASTDTSVGTSGATSSTGSVRTSGLCDTLIGEDRTRCLREQAATGTQGGGSAGAGSTGSGK